MKLYLSLGSNLGNREENMLRACTLLSERVGELLQRSSFYETKPVGFSSPHLFLNNAVEIETQLPLPDILHLTQGIERELGRTTKSRDAVYADRPIDIDLLLYGQEITESEELTLPHPRLHRRRFVLEPLCEIAPDLIVPRLGLSVSSLLRKLNVPRLRELGPADCTNDTLASLNRLLQQLSPSARPLTAEALRQLAQTPTSHVHLVFDEENTLCGMATLLLVQQPTGCKAWIEDVVIDSACRRRGYAQQLTRHLVNVARQSGAQSVNLTSRPERTAANKLYLACGFSRRETNVYKLSL